MNKTDSFYMTIHHILRNILINLLEKKRIFMSTIKHLHKKKKENSPLKKIHHPNIVIFLLSSG